MNNEIIAIMCSLPFVGFALAGVGPYATAVLYVIGVIVYHWG